MTDLQGPGKACPQEGGKKMHKTQLQGFQMKRKLLFLMVLALPSAQATNRYFSDIKTESPNGRYHLEAKSPDNKDGPWKKPFQANFLYRLTNRQTGRELWTRRQPMKEDRFSFPAEGPPVAVHVSNDGWVVIRTADVWGTDIELVALSPQGRETTRCR